MNVLVVVRVQQMSRGVEFTEAAAALGDKTSETSRLSGGGPWLQQQQQHQRGPVVANGSARMFLQVHPPPPHQRFRTISSVSRGKPSVSRL